MANQPQIITISYHINHHDCCRLLSVIAANAREWAIAGGSVMYNPLETFILDSLIEFQWDRVVRCDKCLRCLFLSPTLLIWMTCLFQQLLLSFYSPMLIKGKKIVGYNFYTIRSRLWCLFKFKCPLLELKLYIQFFNTHESHDHIFFFICKGIK